MKVSTVAIDSLIKPMEITIKDPAVLFVQIYTAIIYGIYYSCKSKYPLGNLRGMMENQQRLTFSPPAVFEVFPLVYPVDYHMNLGQIGLVFLCILISCMIGIAIYCGYLYFYVDKRIAKYGLPVQENRLVPALPAAFGPTIGLFLFAWTARESIHWIVPTIGITIYGATCLRRHAVHLHLRAPELPPVRRQPLRRKRLLPQSPCLRKHHFRAPALRQPRRRQGHQLARRPERHRHRRYLDTVLLRRHPPRPQ